MKKIVAFIITLFAFSVSTVQAFKRETYINYVIPVRELSQETALSPSTLDLPDALYKQATLSATPITWLLDFSAISSSTTSSYFKEVLLDPTQEIGALLEIDAALQNAANYKSAFSETSSLLNSYEIVERIKLIDIFMETFFNTFGFYPKVVGAPYLDSFSLEYLQTKYSVVATTRITSISNPNPEINGPFHYFPYFPAKNNALVPAQEKRNKISITSTYWNPSDLDGKSLISSPKGFFDYIKNIHESPLSEFSQVTLGIGNDSPASEFVPSFKEHQNFISSRSGEFNLRAIKFSQFGTWFLQRYPVTSPAYFLRSVAQDKSRAVYSNPFYQVRLTNEGNSRLDHLTIFNNIEAEDHRQKKNFSSNLSLTSHPLITAQNPIEINFDFTKDIPKVEKGLWTILLKDNDKFITFNANNIATNTGLSLPNHPSIKTKLQNDTKIFKFNSQWSPFHLSAKKYLLDLLKFIIIILAILFLFKLPPPKLLSLIKKNILICFTIGLGTLVWMLTMWQSGQLTLFGLGIWGAHSHDALFHLSLIEAFSKNPISFKNPNLFSTNLQNYHFFYDYLLGVFSRLTSISPLTLYFHFAPLLVSLLIGIQASLLLARLKFSKASIVASLLSVYLVGSLGFIPSLLHGQSFWAGESLFWMTQSVTTLVNPPFALSLSVLLGFLLLLDRWSDQLTPLRLIILALVAGILIQIKAYASVILLVSLGIILAKSIFQRKKLLNSHSLIFLFSTLLTIFFFLPSYKSGDSLFIFSPLWFIRSLFAAQDRLDMTRFATAWQVYLSQGIYYKLLVLHLIGIVLFFVGNLGLRLLALPTLISFFGKKTLHQLIAIMTLIGLIIPLVFVQTGNSWNSIQFSYYSLFFLNLLLGPSIVFFLSKSRTIIHLTLSLAIVAFFALPTSIGSLFNYTSNTPSTFISYSELRQLDTLKSLPEGLVLAPSYRELSSRRLTAPKPLFAFDSTAYITSLTGQPVFFSDEVNLEIMDYEYSQEKINTQRFFLTDDESFVTQFLKDTPVRHIYLDPHTKINFDHSILSQLGFKQAFDASGYKLYTKD